MLLECDTCNALVKGEVIASYVSSNQMSWTEDLQYTLCKCPQCLSPLLAVQELDYIIDSMDWGTPKKIYPNNLFHINPVIPEKLKKALLECIQCYKANSNTATVIMCRRTIEGFCSIKGVNESDLAKSIKKLKDERIINALRCIFPLIHNSLPLNRNNCRRLWGDLCIIIK